jgi:chromosome segregation ATPase
VIDVTNELIYEVLKQLQERMSSFERKLDEVKGVLQSLRMHSLAIQQDIQNIYATLVRHESRLDRIEHQLEISEASA